MRLDGTSWVRLSDNARIVIESDPEVSGSPRRSLRAVNMQTGRAFWVTPEGLSRKYKAVQS